MATVIKILFLDLGRKCTRQCAYCFNDPDVKYELNTIQAKKVIKDCSSLGCKYLIFTGGEPLLRKDLFQLMDYSYKVGYKKIKIQTNGDLLNKRIIPKLKDTTIMFSYHEDNFSKIFDFIPRLISNKISFEFNYVINKKTYKNMILFLKRFEQYKDKISFYFTFMTTKNHLKKRCPELLLSLSEAKEEVLKLCRFAKREGYHLVIEDVPRCVLGKYYDFSAEYNRNKNKIKIFGYTENILYHNMDMGAARALKEKEKFDYCYECIYSAECTGVSKSYSDFFKNEEKLVRNITFKGICLDKIEDIKLDKTIDPVLFYLKNKGLLNSNEYVHNLKKFLDKQKTSTKLCTADIPLCFTDNKDIIFFPNYSKENKYCVGCFFNKICNNPNIGSSKSIKKFFEFSSEVKIEITDKCNNNCSYCINRFTFKHKSGDKILTKQELFDFFNQIKKLGIKNIRITGGEPLVRGDLSDILKYLKGNKFYVKLNTNLLLHKKNKEVFRNIDDLLVSINELPFLQNYNKKNYQIKMNGLRQVRGKIKNLSISIIIYDKLIKTANKLFNFCESLKVDNVVFLLPFDISDKKLSYNELHYFLRRMKEQNEKSKKKYVLGHPLPYCLFTEKLVKPLVNYNFLFEYGIGSFVVDPYGNLRMNYFNPKTFGNIKNSNIQELYAKMKQKIEYWKNLQKKCLKCVHLTRCGGLLGSEELNKLIKF